MYYNIKMKILNLLKVVGFLVLMISTSQLYGQFNVKVGYTGGYSNLKTTNTIFDNYNAQNSTDATISSVSKELKAIRFFNGLELGARYKFGSNFGLDIGVTNMSGQKKGEYTLVDASSSVSNDWKISMTNYFVGLESYIGNFGLGANIGYQKMSYKNKANGASDRTTVYSKSVLNSKVYITIEAPSNNMTFALRPYVSFNWDPYNVQDVENTLINGSTQPASGLDQDVMVYGISLLFFNGPQS